MISGINLSAINEEQSENTNNPVVALRTKSNSYTGGLYNPINAISVYMKSFVCIEENCKSALNSLKQIRELNTTKPDKFKLVVAKKRLEIYNNLDKALKILMEFRKVFSLSENHEQYTNFKDFDGRLEFIYDRLALANATLKDEFIKEALIANSYLIKLFTSIHKSMQSSTTNSFSNFDKQDSSEPAVDTTSSEIDFNTSRNS